MLGTVLIAIAFLAANPQTQSIVVQQSSGWCSPNISKVTGDVTVNCIGVDPGALRRLNANLKRKNLQLEERIREADEWASRYKELETRLTAAGDDSVLSKQAETYLHNGELEKAGAVLDRILANEDKEVDRTAANHYNRGLVFELQFQPLEALPHLQRAYQYSPENVEYGVLYGNLLIQQNDFARSEVVLSAVLVTARKQSVKSTEYLPDVAQLQNALGLLYAQTQRESEAEAAFEESLRVRSELAKKDPVKYQLAVAQTLNNLAILYRRTQRMAKAETEYRNALDIYREMAKWNPVESLTGALKTLANLGGLYDEAHDMKRAEAVYLEAVEDYERLSKAYPAAYTPGLASALVGLGDVYAKTQQMAAAETAYTRALDLYEKLARNDPAVYLPLLADTLNGLSVVCRKLGRLESAVALSLRSVAIFRELTNANPATYEAKLANSLNTLGNGYFSLYQREHVHSPDQECPQSCREAESAYQESLQIRQKLAKLDPQAYKPDLAMTLNGLGSFYLLTRRPQQAAMTFRQALDIYSDLALVNPAVYRQNVAMSWNSLGNAYRDATRMSEAEEAFLNSLRISRDLAKENPDEQQPMVALTLSNLAMMYFYTGRLPEAANYIAESVAIYREQWRTHHDESVAADFGRSLVLDVMVQSQLKQPPTVTCPLLLESLSVIRDSELKRLTEIQARDCRR
jgi:hypothetical protein